MGVPVARIFGIEIRVQWGWVFVLALIGVLAFDQLQMTMVDLEPAIAWLLAALIAAGFFLSSAFHDLIHALVARRRGVAVPSIAVSFFGGVTPLDPMASNARDDLAIALAGPLASLGIAGVFGLLGAGAAAIGGELTVVATIFAVLLVLNLLLGGINLVPAYPLDGGRVIRALAWRRTGSERQGWRAAGLSGRLSGLAALAAGLLVMLVGSTLNGAMIALSGWFLILSARSIRDRVRIDELLGGLQVRDAMDEVPATVHRTLSIDTFADQLLDGASPMIALPVIEDDRVVGLVGLRQVRGIRRGRWPTTRVEEVMAAPPRLALVSPEDDLTAAVAVLGRSDLDGLPVVDADGRLIGLLTRPGVGKLVASRLGQGPTIRDASDEDPSGQGSSGQGSSGRGS
jgi:Zn-dependent protease/CBS domain-containing protein